MVEYHKLDVYRDKDGNPVTITQEQCEMIKHNMRVWFQVRKQEGYWDISDGAYLKAFLRSCEEGNPFGAEVTKSCLLGRLLYDGGRPLKEPPPVCFSAPNYYVAEHPEWEGCKWIALRPENQAWADAQNATKVCNCKVEQLRREAEREREDEQ